eukprot:1187639-Prorocentrum_minimum.AAC.6
MGVRRGFARYYRMASLYARSASLPEGVPEGVQRGSGGVLRDITAWCRYMPAPHPDTVRPSPPQPRPFLSPSPPKTAQTPAKAGKSGPREAKVALLALVRAASVRIEPSDHWIDCNSFHSHPIRRWGAMVRARHGHVPTAYNWVLGGELISPVVKWHLKGLTDNSQLGHFLGVRKYSGGELNSPVVEWLNKGLIFNASVEP